MAGQVLESYTGPSWALIIANVALVAHMLTAFQVFGQAMFNSIERWAVISALACRAWLLPPMAVLARVLGVWSLHAII